MLIIWNSLCVFIDQNCVMTIFYSHRHCVDAPTVLQQCPTIEVATILMQPISPQLHVNASEALEGQWMWPACTNAFVIILHRALKGSAMNWLDFVLSIHILVFMPLPNSAAKEEDPVASSRTVFLSRLSMMMFAMVVMLMLMVASYGDHRKSQW